MDKSSVAPSDVMKEGGDADIFCMDNDLCPPSDIINKLLEKLEIYSSKIKMH
jgi:hypothetical protein